MNGEHVGANDSVAQIVDCEQDFLLVEIPQERVPDVALSGQARFRLSGEAYERTGLVLSTNRDLPKEINRKLAALPERASGEQLATVLVAFNPNDKQKDCTIGRTARVLVPTVKGSNLISRWFRHYF
jgi:hypothetical protein